MKTANSFLVLLLMALAGQPLFAKNNPASLPSGEEVLKNCAARLTAFKTVRYYHQRDYFTGDKHYLIAGHSFIDFNSPDELVGLKYQVKAGDFEYYFNGTEAFSLDKRSKLIEIDTRPQPDGMPGGSFFNNSLVSLRRTLPLINQDKTIEKTLKDSSINSNEYYLIGFTLRKKILGYFEGFSSVSENRDFYFRLLISKKNYLPFMLLQSNNKDEHSSTVTYSDIEPGKEVDENSWYYSSYLKDYKVAGKKEPKPLLAVGSRAPLFELTRYTDGSKMNTSDFAGKVLVLEFWIRNCGPCIASVPELNALYEEYKSRGVAVLAVNAADKKPTIDYFVNKYRPTYPIAYDGEKLSNGFGVDGFPVVFIIDKTGTVAYSGQLDQDAVRKVLARLIN